MSQGDTGRAREWALRLALVGAGVAVALVLAEVALRVHHVLSFTGSLADLGDDRPLPPPGESLPLGAFLSLSADPGIVYQGRPGVQGLHEGVSVRINSLGWREDEIPFEKAPGTFRIVGIGDSVMFGWRVEESERYLDRLEERLRRERPERRWETVALAMPGYNLMNEIEVLRRVGMRFEPDLILYGYVRNDACLPKFVVEPLEVFSTSSFVAHNLSLLLWDESGAVPAGEAVEGDPDEVDRARCALERIDPRYAHLAGQDNLLRALDELAALGRETGVPVVLLFDGRGGTHPNAFSPFVPEGIVVIDLYRRFARHFEEEGLPGYWHPRLRIGGRRGSDHHPTAEAHGVIADGLYQALLREGLLP